MLHVDVSVQVLPFARHPHAHEFRQLAYLRWCGHRDAHRRIFPRDFLLLRSAAGTGGAGRLHNRTQGPILTSLRQSIKGEFTVTTTQAPLGSSFGMRSTAADVI